MRGSICRRLQRFATTTAIGLASTVALCAYASNLLVPTEPLPKQAAFEVIPSAVINNSNTTIGVADSDMWGLTTADGQIDIVAIDRHLDELHALGVDTIRVQIPWAGAQPVAPGTLPPEWEATFWERTDYIINAAAERDMAILGVLNSTPGWGIRDGSGGWGLGASPDPAKFAAYAEVVADRYEGKVSAYEIWNEPNAVPYWTPRPDPVAYTEVLKAAYTAIKSADPNALVVAGVLGAVISWGDVAMDPRTYVATMYANDAEGSFDALSFHPYQYTTKFSDGDVTAEAPWNANSPLEMLIGIRQLMIDNGDENLRIWATEYGLPTGGPNAVTPQHQADYIADFLGAWGDLAYTGPAFIYTTVDRGDGTEDGSFGLFYADWTPKPAAGVVSDAITGPESDEEAFYQALGDAFAQAYADAFAQAVADAFAQAVADAFAQAVADAFALAVADAFAQAMAGAFGTVADPAAPAPALPAETEAETEAAVAEGTTAAAEPVTAPRTERLAETPTAVIGSEEATTEDLAATQGPARHLFSTRQASGDSKDDSDEAAGNKGTVGTTGTAKQAVGGVRNEPSPDALKANDDTETKSSGAAGSTPSESAA